MSDEKHWFHCADCCREDHTEGADDWMQAWSWAKAAGWRCKEVDGEWHRWCPKCVRKWAMRNKPQYVPVAIRKTVLAARGDIPKYGKPGELLDIWPGASETRH